MTKNLTEQGTTTQNIKATAITHRMFPRQLTGPKRRPQSVIFSVTSAFSSETSRVSQSCIRSVLHTVATRLSYYRDYTGPDTTKDIRNGLKNIIILKCVRTGCGATRQTQVVVGHSIVPTQTRK